MAKIIFAGTPEFAAKSLAALLNTPHEIIAVYTQPDRPAGRGQKLAASPVKQLALQYNLPVLQPNTLKTPVEQEKLQSFNADLMIVAAYGLILPAAVLQAPRLGCLNIHASLLPRWRGAAPIQRAILAGDHETGITLMQMDEGLDTGAMLVKASCPILASDTSESLHDRLAELAATTLISALENILASKIKAETQDSSQATYASKISKEEGKIDWQKDALSIDRQIRAFNSWPVAYTALNEQHLRILEAKALSEDNTGAPGTIMAISKSGLDVATGQGILRLLKVQLPGSKALAIADFLNARKDDFKVGHSFK